MNAPVMSVSRLLMSFVGGSLLIAGASAARPDVRRSAAAIPGVVHYLTPDGADYAALILPAPVTPVTSASVFDHVVIVDTSASQSGEFRQRELSLISAFCSALPDSDRIMLIASDVSADDLTSGFVAADSPEFVAGFERLNDRIPLGCSDLETALRTALGRFHGVHARSILYLGDGFSAAKLIQFPAMQKLTRDLQQAGVPVNSVAIGPRTDLVMLGALAQHTGGICRIDEPGTGHKHEPVANENETSGAELVHAARSPVFYPTAMKTLPEIEDFASSSLPPVRFDRETVVLARGFNKSDINVQMTGRIGGKSHDLAWHLQSEKLVGSTGFVYQAWKLAHETDGMVMPFAGRSLLLRFRDEYQQEIGDLSDAISVELQRKNLSEADELAKSLLRLDPGSSKAGQILTSTKRLRVRPMSYQRPRVIAQTNSEPDSTNGEPADVKPSDPLVLDKDSKSPEKQEVEGRAVLEETPATDVETESQNPKSGASAPSVDANDRSNPNQHSLLEELTTRQRLRIQELTAEVNRAVDDSSRLAISNFEDAVAQLKDLINVVDGALELPESIRMSLRRKLDSSLQKLENENEVVVQKAAALRTKQSQLESRRKLMDQAERDEQRMQQLIERVRALIVRGVKGEAEAFEEAEEYSRIAVELDPYNSVPNQDVFNSEAFGALDKARRMRALRADKFLAELYEVERAHVPFPDEPPILWPSAERWREITIKREKWKSVDLKNYSKQEEKIVSALNKPMKEKFDFVDATLEDVRNRIVEVYDINVILDKVKLEEESITTDSADINLSISDISLKNALKLLLDPIGLTFAVQDEVLLITPKSEGSAKKPIKAYYAGDLAIPVNPYASMMGGRGGSMGGRGGMGGGMGGMGGGMMGGMGGGMGGMGMGGMGGGMY